MGPLPTYFKVLSGVAVVLLLMGLLSVSQRTNQPHKTLEYDFRPHMTGDTARIESLRRELNLADRRLVFNRQVHEIDNKKPASEKKPAVGAKGQAVADKKKAKAKKDLLKKKKVAAKTTADDDAESADPRDRSENIDTAAAGPSVPPSVAPYKPQGPNAEEALWRERLLKRPDARATSDFIDAYVTNSVTKETFYTIIAEMLKDSRLDMNSLAVQALEATPSYASFEALVLALPDAPKAIQTDIVRAIDRYKQTVYLTVLEEALSSQETAVLYEALRILRQSTDEVFQQARDDAQGNPRTVRGLGTVAGIDSFKALLRPLTVIAQSGDPSVAEMAFEVIDSIERLDPAFLTLVGDRNQEVDLPL